MHGVLSSTQTGSLRFDYVNLVEQGRPWWQNSRLVILNAWIAVLLITSSTNGEYDEWIAVSITMARGFSPSVWRKTIQNIGSLCAYPFAPYLADGYGRKKAIALGALLMCFGAIVQTAARSVDMFIGARFIIGFGLTFAATSAPLLILELSYPTQRGQVTSLYNTLWFFGSVIAAWSTFGTFRLSSSWAWRIPSALQGLPSVIQLSAIWWLPESPRYLVSKGMRTEALRTLAYYHADGNEEHPLVEYEFEEIKAALLLEKVATKHISWRSLIGTKGNRRRMRVIIAIAFFSQWSGNGLISYYLSKVLSFVHITRPEDQLLISGFLNIFNLICAVLAGLLCDRVGRRKLFLASNGSMLIFWTLLTVTLSIYTQDHSQAAAYVFVVLIYLYTCAYAIAYTPLIVSYTLEILPFALRARGFTVFNFMITLSVIFNQYINPVLLDKIGWKYYLVYVCWLAFELVFIYFYILETKGRTLEETGALFDGAETVEDITFRASVLAGLDTSRDRDGGDRKGGDRKHRPSLPELYELDNTRSECTTPSPLSSENRKSLPINFQDMPYVLEVTRPEECHVKDDYLR
ncbi:hypothetical protein M422DRAFT_782652 [Sphaerobolus stellatus SS14]|uniref:Major facilitator superfamily (MFS) profile domain-containing protein n=1 Tax=Sphaerobolus stellatus (strain SS14) TaxID=990650 RepID=A0A0C9V019_SPHS4|nr:hypothetical protein M422DRAFT_782652 [Sphaerobolus stellatus SS14]